MSPTGWAPNATPVGARPRSSLGQALRAKLFRQFVRRQAGSHRNTGSQQRATQLLHRSPTGWAPTGSVHRFRGSAPQIKSGAGSAREAFSPVRSPAGRLPQKHWLALACNTVALQGQHTVFFLGAHPVSDRVLTERSEGIGRAAAAVAKQLNPESRLFWQTLRHDYPPPFANPRGQRPPWPR